MAVAACVFFLETSNDTKVEKCPARSEHLFLIDFCVTNPQEMMAMEVRPRAVAARVFFLEARNDTKVEKSPARSEIFFVF